MSSLGSNANSQLAIMASFVGEHRTVLLGLALLPVPFLLTSAYRDYNTYLSLGRNGMPYNVFGWLLQMMLKPIARRDLRVPAPWDKDKEAAKFGANMTRKFLPAGLEKRRGARPEVPYFVAPQRQATEKCDVEPRKDAMQAFLSALAREESASPVIYQRPSKLEGLVPALGLREDGQVVDPRATYKGCRGEVAHVHPSEGSSHVVLSLADAEEVIGKGWGQRHALSGVVLHWGYTLVYAPRDEDEVEVWKGIMRAGVDYCVAEVRMK
jgi:hypothetical protein